MIEPEVSLGKDGGLVLSWVTKDVKATIYIEAKVEESSWHVISKRLIYEPRHNNELPGLMGMLKDTTPQCVYGEFLKEMERCDD